MSAEKSKTIVQRYFSQVATEGNLAAVDELFSQDIAFHDPAAPEDLQGTEAVKQFFSALHVAFPDLYFTVDELFAVEDKVAARWTVRGTHKGELMGIAPTKNQVTVSGVDIFHIMAGKIHEVWVSLDTLKFMQQLGVVPLPG